MRFMMSACARGIGFGFLISCLSLITMSVLLVSTLSEKEHEIDSIHISSSTKNIVPTENVSYSTSSVEVSDSPVANCNGPILDEVKQAELTPADHFEPGPFETGSGPMSCCTLQSRCSSSLYLCAACGTVSSSIWDSER